MIPVSLGIPMFKSERFLPALFATLRSLDPKPSEIILLDDASPDGSYQAALSLASRFPAEITVLRNATNSGIAGAYNLLAASARERWVHILDADDVPVETDFYARVLPRLSKDVLAVVTAVDSNSRALRVGSALLGRFVPPYPPQSWPLLGSFATRSGVIYRRDRLLTHGFPDPAYPGSDIVHLLSLRQHGRIAYERRAHVFYNVHPLAASSQTRDYAKYRKALRAFKPLIRLTHLGDLILRQVGQKLDRS